MVEVRRPTLPCSTGVESPFHPFSRMKPRMMSSSVFAQTTNTSAIGLLVIQVLAPDSR